MAFAYRGVPVLEGVNLAVGQRQTVCMVGPNGGGKTTLMRLILGLLRPDRGRSAGFSASRRSACGGRIGYMPQHVRHDPQFPRHRDGYRAHGPLGARRRPRAAGGGMAAPTGGRPLTLWSKSTWKR